MPRLRLWNVFAHTHIDTDTDTVFAHTDIDTDTDTDIYDMAQTHATLHSFAEI